MSKFFGQIGFALSVDDGYGVWKDEITERTYKGDIVRNTRRWERSEYLNDDLAITNNISVVADSFCIENLSVMKYVKWRGSYWKITNVEIQEPRIILTLGGVYNGERAQT
jgi:hypothetical protein